MFYDVCRQYFRVKFELENFQINDFNVRTFLGGINKYQTKKSPQIKLNFKAFFSCDDLWLVFNLDTIKLLIFCQSKNNIFIHKSLYGHFGLIDLDVGEIISKGSHKFDPFRIELKEIKFYTLSSKKKKKKACISILNYLIYVIILAFATQLVPNI